MNSSYTDWAWSWWTVIVAINVVNLVVCALVIRKSLKPKDGTDSVYRRRMRIMGVVFTLVGAYRAVFVSRYLTQMAWFDSIANSSLLIRIFACAAELSFSGLIALGMLRVNEDVPVGENNHAGKLKMFLTAKSPYFLWICIFIAQFFAFGGLIMKSRTLFAIEETLWSLGFLFVLPLAIIQVRRVFGVKDPAQAARLRPLRWFTILTPAWCVFYCCYGLFYHLPFESWSGAINQIQTGIPVIKTGVSAIVDAFVIVNESKAYGDWGFGFLLWHSAYFTICVWISIFMMQAPRIVRREGVCLTEALCD
jgi:hypothetical protein